MQELAMSTEVWAIISAVIVILVAIATSHRALRQEMNERFREVHERIDGLAERVTDLRAEMIERFGTVDQRITALRTEMIERFATADQRIAALRTEMIERFATADQRIAALRTEMTQRFADLRGELIDRLSHVEGLLEGIGHVVRKRTGKERRDAEHGPAAPQP